MMSTRNLLIFDKESFSGLIEKLGPMRSVPSLWEG
jgi:hypothetical protein